MSLEDKRIGIDADHLFYIEDCVRGMQSRIKDDSIDLVFADPPFNIRFGESVAQYKFGISGDKEAYYEDAMTKEEYLAWSKKWMQEVHRVLRPAGIFVLVSGWSYGSWLHVLACDDVGFGMINEMVWRYEFGLYTKRKRTSSHYNIYILVKGDPEKVKWTYNKLVLGTSEEDVIRDMRFFDTDKKILTQSVSRAVSGLIEYWEGTEKDLIDNIRRLTKRYVGIKHGCKLNEDVPLLFINQWTNPGDTVLDPFMGSGTSMVAAIKTNRKYVGFEIEPKYDKTIRAILARRIGNTLIPFETKKEIE